MNKPLRTALVFILLSGSSSPLALADADVFTSSGTLGGVIFTGGARTTGDQPVKLHVPAKGSGAPEDPQGSGKSQSGSLEEAGPLSKPAAP